MAETTPAGPKLPISLESLRKQRKPLHDVNKEVRKQLKALDKLALWITERVGTMGFFLIILTWTVLWLGWNIIVPKQLKFDPPMAFVFWLFISNMIQILLMPLIMVGQNLQGRHAEARAESDLEVNIKAEREVEAILQHLEYQNEILLALVRKMDVDLAAVAPPAAPAKAPRKGRAQAAKRGSGPT
jgi:uncharacterized membrane protein